MILILILSAVGLKFLFLPSIVSLVCKQNGYIAIFVGMLVDFLILGIFVYLLKKNPDLNFKQILEQIFGKAFSKIILILYALLFLVKAASSFQSHYLFLYESLYEELKWYVFTFCGMFVMFIVCTKRLRVFARLIEVIFFIVLFFIIISFALGATVADFSEIFPILENGIKDVIGIKDFSIWFGDYIVMVILFGNVKISKNFSKKVFLLIALTIVLVSLSYMVYYCLYANTAIIQKNSIANIVEIIPYSSDFGRVSWIIVLLWLFALFSEACLMIYCAMTCMSFAFGAENKIPALLISFIFFSSSNTL